MDKQTIVNFYESEKTCLKRQLDAFEAGRLHTSEDVGAGWVDTTDRNKMRLKGDIAELDRVIELCRAAQFQ